MAPVVAAGPAVAVAEAPVLARTGDGQRGGLGRGALRGGAAERASGRGDEASGLGAHAKHAAAAWGEDLEVEVSEAHPELRRRRP